jgi:hypothetical protein
LLYPAELRAQNERGQYVALESQKSSAKQGESPQTSNVTPGTTAYKPQDELGKCPANSIFVSPLTISAKPVGVEAALPLSIPRGETISVVDAHGVSHRS